MRAYSSMPPVQLVDQIKTIAIRASASPLVIAKLDELLDLSDAEQIEKDQQEAVDAAKDDCKQYIAKKWHKSRASAVFKLNGVAIGLTETQIEQVLEVIDCMEPSL